MTKGFKNTILTAELASLPSAKIDASNMDYFYQFWGPMGPNFAAWWAFVSRAGCVFRIELSSCWRTKTKSLFAHLVVIVRKSC